MSQYLRGTFGDVDSDRYNRSSELDIWTVDNPSNTYFGLRGPGLQVHPKKGNTRVALEHQLANFWRISDITLGYTLPQSLINRLGIGSLRIYGQAQNAFVFTDFLSFDPEYNSGSYDDDVPFATILFGVDFTF